MAIVNCPECGGKLADSVKKCIHCGCSVIRCDECGAVNLATSSSCKECGNVLSKKASTDDAVKVDLGDVTEASAETATDGGGSPSEAIKAASEVFCEWDKNSRGSAIANVFSRCSMGMVVVAIVLLIASIVNGARSSDFWFGFVLSPTFAWAMVVAALGSALVNIEDVITRVSFANWIKEKGIDLKAAIGALFTAGGFSSAEERFEAGGFVGTDVALDLVTYQTSYSPKSARYAIPFVTEGLEIIGYITLYPLLYRLIIWYLPIWQVVGLNISIVSAETWIYLILCVAAFTVAKILGKSMKKKVIDARDKWMYDNYRDYYGDYDKYVKRNSEEVLFDD